MDHQDYYAQSPVESATQAEGVIALELEEALGSLKLVHAAALRSILTEAEHADFEAFLCAVTPQSLGFTVRS